MKSIVYRYQDILNKLGYPPIMCSDYFHRSHLNWMLGEIIENKDQSLTKKHRWLGYVQGILCYQGILDVDKERDLTRGVFNGA